MDKNYYLPVQGYKRIRNSYSEIVSILSSHVSPRAGRDTSTNYQKDNVELVYMFAKFLGDSKTFNEIKDGETIIVFLDVKRKSKEQDPEQKWITTWNDYLWRLKMFYRWLLFQ